MPNYRTNIPQSRGQSYIRPLDIPYSQMDPGYTRYENETSYGNKDDIADFPLAMAYVPYQIWNEVYTTDEILSKGTLFPELYKPFMGAGRR